MFARVDIVVTEFPTKAAEKEEKKMGSEIFFNVGVPIPFSMGNFHFLAAEKLIGGGTTSKLASQ